MKKLLSFLIVLMMIISLVACSGNDSKKEIINESNQTEEDTNEDNESSTDVDTDAIDTDEISNSDTVKVVPLPENYPEDLLPIMEGSKVDFGGQSESNGKEEIFVRLLSSKDTNEIFEFYKDVLSEKTDIDESQFAGILTIKCFLEYKDITIDVLETNEYDGFISLIRITILGNPSSSQDNENGVNDVSDTKNANNDLVNEDKIPEDYPLQLVPIYGGSTIYDSGVFEMEKEMYYINCYSNDDFEKIIDFYKGLFSDIENKEVSNFDSGGYQIGGDIDDRHILISIYKEDEDSNFKSFFSLHVDK